MKKIVFVFILLLVSIVSMADNNNGTTPVEMNASSMRFNTLEVKKNLFYGINSINDLLVNITNVGTRVVSGNVFIKQ